VPEQRKLLIGIVGGAVAGLLAGRFMPPDVLAPVVEYVTYPVGQIFLRLLFMLAVPLIFAALVVGVGELDLKALGRIGLKTLAMTVVVSTIAVLIGLVLVNAIAPGAGVGEEVRALARSLASQRQVVKPPETAGVSLFIAMVPDNPIKAAATGDMIALMVFALIFGIGLNVTNSPGAQTLRRTIEGLNDVVMRLIGWVMRLAPYGVAALLFTTMAALGLDILARVALFVVVVLGGLALHMFVVYPLFLTVLARRNPVTFFRGVRLAMETAFATASSSATLPTTLRVADENLRLPPALSRFVLTAGASMNQNGTALFEGVTVLFLAQVFQVDLTLAQQATIMFICVLGGIGTAGIPGGSLPVVAMILGMFRIPPEGLALVMGVDRFLDMCRTTVNVTGDLVVAACAAQGEPAARPPAPLGSAGGGP
jgi:DAACS family dicarboxylate/amino acid:cation (Na+ or H+) symporter